MKKIKTPLDHKLEAILVARNRAKSRWGFYKDQRTLGDMLVNAGYHRGDIDYTYNSQALKQITIQDINDYFNTAEQKARIEAQHKVCPPAETDLEAYKDYFQIRAEVARPLTKEELFEEVEIVDSYNPRPPSQKAKLHPKQAQAARRIFNDIISGRATGILLRATTGVGKTYVLGSVIRNLFDCGFFNDCVSPYPFVYVTKASIVEQTERVLVNEFGLDPIKQIKVINIEQLRSYFGNMFLQKMEEVVHGETHEIWRWRKFMHPKVIFWDESHILKNEDSEQAKIGQAFNRIPQLYGAKVYQVFSSATPYLRVAEARVFCCSTGVTFPYGLSDSTPVDDSNWHEFARWISRDLDPYDYAPAAVERLTKKMEPWICRMTNVRPKFHAHNTVRAIDFRTPEERQQYLRYWDKFQAEKARIEGLDVLSKPQTHMAILAQFNKFCEGAELVRAPLLADMAVETWEEGKTLGIAVKHKGTILSAVKRLIHYHGWSRDDISIIWGGSAVTLNRKKKLALKLHKNENIVEALKAAGIDLKEFGLDFSDEELAVKTDEELEWEKTQRLLHQDKEARQLELDRYQHQKTKCCFFTYKSGGAGLSLHHEYPYARQRKGVFAPVYSGIDLVQVLGRLPRLTSLSDTDQEMIYYNGTIEVQVAAKVALKLTCLGRVVRQHEDWSDIVTGYQSSDSEDEDEEIDGTYVEDDEA